MFFIFNFATLINTTKSNFLNTTLMNTGNLKRLILFSLLYIFHSSHLLADIGMPNLSVYDKDVYSAGRQNWDIETDSNGILYFANSEGLLYNVGDEWHLVPVKKNHILHSICNVNDTIWSGGNEIGYFARSSGELMYHQILKSDEGHIWNIEQLDSKLYFQAENGLYIYDLEKKEYKFKSIKDAVWCIVKMHDRIWLTLRNGSLGYLENEDFVEVGLYEELQKAEIRKMIVHRNELYILSFEGELYRYSETGLTDILDTIEIDDCALFTAFNNNDENICIGSISDGFFQIDSDGKILQHISTNQGLLDNTVLAIALDNNGNIWMGLDYGLSKLDTQSAINYIFKGAATYSSIKYKDQIYTATNKGVFSINDNNLSTLIPNTQGQVWSMHIINNELYFCHNRGLYKLEDKEAVVVATFGGVMDIANIPSTDYYIFSTYYGLVLSKFENNQFTYLRNLEKWGYENIISDNQNNCIWAEALDKNILKINLKSDGELETNIFENYKRVFETTKGVFFYDQDKLFSCKNGEFSEIKQNLFSDVKGKSLTALQCNETGSTIAYVQNGQVYVKILLPDGNSLSYNTFLRSISNDLIDRYQFLNLTDGNLYIATDRGLVRFNLGFNSRENKISIPIITSFTTSGNENRQYVFPYEEEQLEFDSDIETIKFKFGTNKSIYDVVEYRYRLFPQHEWTEWSTDNDEALFVNLTGGKYSLYIQCRLNGGQVNETNLEFYVSSSWWNSSWFIMFVLILVIVVLIVILFFVRKVNEKRMDELHEDFQKEKAETALSLKNDQLMQYAEIISHKNEFLNRVKDGLKDIKSQEAQRWVNLISTEVNHEKQEFLFYKLFSEVQQDFISRVTEKYPSLTSNDIRVLSYIRINLDNKEISNLLNITPRSLETNRYRLRKKMELDQDVDLNQFVRKF